MKCSLVGVIIGLDDASISIGPGAIGGPVRVIIGSTNSISIEPIGSIGVPAPVAGVIWVTGSFALLFLTLLGSSDFSIIGCSLRFTCFFVYGSSRVYQGEKLGDLRH